MSLVGGGGGVLLAPPSKKIKKLGLKKPTDWYQINQICMCAALKVVPNTLDSARMGTCALVTEVEKSARTRDVSKVNNTEPRCVGSMGQCIVTNARTVRTQTVPGGQ